MSIYRILPRSAYIKHEYWTSTITADTVICDDEPVHVGLVDGNGNPIVRVKDPIGFIRPSGRKDPS